MTHKQAGGAVKASHVFLKTLIKTHFGHAKLDPRPEDLDLISTVFVKYGGSWVGVFQGSITDITKLKQVVKVAAKTDRVTKAAQWLPKPVT